jgi:hypothetical protein
MSGCAGKHYDKVTPGTLTGKLRVEWMAPDRFLYEPDEDDPLTFVRVIHDWLFRRQDRKVEAVRRQSAEAPLSPVPPRQPDKTD